jgi:hypothetical protein
VLSSVCVRVRGVYAGVAWLMLEILGAWTTGGDVTAGVCLEKTSGLDFISNIYYLLSFRQYVQVASAAPVTIYDSSI